MPSLRSKKGFTLLEILVALAVLSIALMAALKSSGVAIQNTSALKERTLAHWVMLNRVAELELDRRWISLGTTRGKTLMAGQTWYWVISTEKTPDPDIRMAEVSVGLGEKDNALVSMVAFLDRP
ncbi:MAG: type II secretion system minor pseudopilin GspI [Desulfoarculaceae bacterium]|nr:type II secretion system minor pseudopilin GspI [Desulfoarculaceae bacterium]